MPTIKELKSLYRKGTGTRNMTSHLKSTGWWIWSGDTKGSSSAFYLDFLTNYKCWDDCTASDEYRALAVREAGGE